MRNIILLLLCLAASCATSPREGSADIRVTTFNIRYATADDGPDHWLLRQNYVIETIRSFDPDVLGTQECLAEQRDFIVARLPHYAAVAAGRDDGKDAGEMTATFYRRDRFDLLDSGHFWVSETPAVAGSISWDSSMTRMVTWLKLRDQRNPDSKPILVMNTHFDHRGETARLESAGLIARRAAEMGCGCSIIVMGDFNCDEDDPPYRALVGGAAPRLFDVYRRIHPARSGDEATFHAFKSEAVRGNRIDWILASDDLTPVNAQIDRRLFDGRPASDHFAIHATVSPRR